MTRFGWELPTRVTGPHAIDLYEQIALAADQTGFDRLVVPFDPEGDDSIILGGHLSRTTRRIAVDIELHPGAGSPVYLAKLFATLERATNQRVGVQLRTHVGESYERAVGDALTNREREDRQKEFWTVFRGVWRDEPAVHDAPDSAWTFRGDFFGVVAGGLSGALSGLRLPRLAQSVGDAQVIDPAADVVYAGLAADGTERDLERARTDAQRAGSDLGLVVPVLARADTDEAWSDLDDLARRSGVTDAGSRRQSGGRWAGFDQLGLRLPVGLVGSYDEIATRLRELIDRYDLSEITLSGTDAIADVYRSAENLLPAIDTARVPEGERA